MAESALCNRQDTCPLLLQALEEKHAAQAAQRVSRRDLDEATAAFNTKRTLFNEFYTLVVECRKAQRQYFSTNTQSSLIAAKEAEKKLDAHLNMLKSASSRQVVVSPDLDFTGGL